MTREEALETVGKRLQRNEPPYGDVPVGTTGTVMHANLVHWLPTPTMATLTSMISSWRGIYLCRPV